MLTRRQLEDLSKCGYIHCANCSCAPICEGEEMKSAQTALVLADMLKRLERVYDSQFNEYFCPICKAGEEVGHFEDCELAAILKGLEGSE